MMPASAPLAVVRFHQMPRMSAGKARAAIESDAAASANSSPVQREPAAPTATGSGRPRTACGRPAARRSMKRRRDRGSPNWRSRRERVGRGERRGNRAGRDQRRRHVGQVRHLGKRAPRRRSPPRRGVARADYGADRLQWSSDGVDAADADEAEPAEGEQPIGDIVELAPTTPWRMASRAKAASPAR